MSQAKSGFSLIRPRKLSPEEFKAVIVGKGWRLADVACRWGIRPETLSRHIADIDRDSKWDDLARSLPKLSRLERAAATSARLALMPTKKRIRKKLARKEPPPMQETQDQYAPQAEDSLGNTPANLSTRGLRYQGYVTEGDELVATIDIGEFAREGDYLYVRAVRLTSSDDGAIREEYLAQADSGEKIWLTPDQMDDWVAATGRTSA